MLHSHLGDLFFALVQTAVYPSCQRPKATLPYTQVLPSPRMLYPMQPNLAGKVLLCGALMVLSPTALAKGFTVTLAAQDAALACGSKTTPILTFGTPPAGTKALAFIFWDQQPRKLTGRWLVWDLPLGTRVVSAQPAGNSRVSGAPVAVNEAGQLGYTAICSPGRHDVYIDFYALNVPSLAIAAGAPLQTVHAAIKKHKILEAKAHVTLFIK